MLKSYFYELMNSRLKKKPTKSHYRSRIPFHKVLTKNTIQCIYRHRCLRGVEKDLAKFSDVSFQNTSCGKSFISQTYRIKTQIKPFFHELLGINEYCMQGNPLLICQLGSILKLKQKRTLYKGACQKRRIKSLSRLRKKKKNRKQQCCQKMKSWKLGVLLILDKRWISCIVYVKLHVVYALSNA